MCGGGGQGGGKKGRRVVNVACCLAWTRGGQVRLAFSDFHLKNIGACNISEYAISKTLLLKVAAKNFQTCPQFPTNGLHKTTLMIFEILRVIFTEFFSKISNHHCTL